MIAVAAYKRPDLYMDKETNEMKLVEEKAIGMKNKIRAVLSMGLLHVIFYLELIDI